MTKSTQILLRDPLNKTETWPLFFFLKDWLTNNKNKHQNTRSCPEALLTERCVKVSITSKLTFLTSCSVPSAGKHNS